MNGEVSLPGKFGTVVPNPVAPTAVEAASLTGEAFDLPKGPFRTVFSTESDSVLFYYSLVNLLRSSDSHYSKYSKSVQNVVIY